MNPHIKYVVLLLLIALMVCSAGCVGVPKLSRDEQQILMSECLTDAHAVYLESTLWQRNNDKGVMITNIAAALFEYRTR